MKIGIPKEIKEREDRVAVTPSGVTDLVHFGHEVYIEKGAGLGSGFTDSEYVEEGAHILDDAGKVYSTADMVVKVKEPLPTEYKYFKDGQTIFTYFHLAPEPELTDVLLEKNITAIAYETVQLDNGNLPLLVPMSEIAGRMSIQIGARLLENINGGMGILLGGATGVEPADVVIVGGGNVGTNAAKMAVGLGANVTVIDVSTQRLSYLNDIFNGRINTLVSNKYNIAKCVKKADLVIGAVLIPGARTPKLVTEDMVKSMKKGSVLVDVAIDQGGSIETIDHATTHGNPYFVKYGVIHYSVANIPGSVPRTSTMALTNATMPYILELANKGVVKALKENMALFRGLNTYKGKLTYKAVADEQKKPYFDAEILL